MITIDHFRLKVKSASVCMLLPSYIKNRIIPLLHFFSKSKQTCCPILILWKGISASLPPCFITWGRQFRSTITRDQICNQKIKHESHFQTQLLTENFNLIPYEHWRCLCLSTLLLHLYSYCHWSSSRLQTTNGMTSKTLLKQLLSCLMSPSPLSGWRQELHIYLQLPSVRQSQTSKRTKHEPVHSPTVLNIILLCDSYSK